MKIIFYLTIILAVISKSNNAQDWQRQNSGTTQNLSSVFFINQNVGWAVGENGAVIKSVDGGANWSIKNINTTHPLRNVQFVNDYVGWIVGGHYDGIIFKTTDGGINWIQQTSSAATSLTDGSFINENVGYVVGFSGAIKYTSNGGNLWGDRSIGGRGLETVFFINSNYGWIGSDKNILRTTDGGANWIAYSPSLNTWFYSIYFSDINNGWAVGKQGTIFHTTDAGISWLQQTSNSSNNFSSTCFLDNNAGYTVGESGTILKTSNGGSTWTTQSSNISGSLSSVYFLDKKTGWAVGSTGTIIKTVNAPTNVSGSITTNTTWTKLGSPYIVTGSITINSGVKLKIGPGVNIKFNKGTQLVVNGEINARGANAEKILFTSNLANPQSGDWESILFTGSSVQSQYSGKTYLQGCILEHCIIEYAGLSVGALRLQTKAAPFLKDIIIRNGNSAGIITEGYKNQSGVQTVAVVNVLVTNNKSNGIFLSQDSNLSLFNSTITQNGGTGVTGEVYSGAYFDSCKITYNAGGIGLWSRVNISNSTIANNSGEGISLPSYMSVSSLVANNCKFINNGGAAIDLYGDKGGSSIQNCIFIDNGTNILFNVKPTKEADAKCLIKNNVFIDSKDCVSINLIVSIAPAIQIINNVFISNSPNAILSTYNDVEFTNNLVVINKSNSTPAGKLVFYKTASSFAQNNLINITNAFDIYDNIGNTSGDFTAANNYWNTINTDSIKARIYDWYKDPAKSKVVFTPVLSLPNTSTPISLPKNVIKTESAGGVKIQWKPNTESDLSGYKIYWKNATGYSFSNSVNVGNVTSYILSNASLSDTIAVTAYDKSITGASDQLKGNESWFSTATYVSLNILSPIGGEEWKQGTQQSIKWTSSNVNNIKIELTTDAGTTWNTIISSIPASTGIYQWTVPNVSSAKCKIRISDLANLQTYSLSGAVFSIAANLPLITISNNLLPSFGDTEINTNSTSQSYTVSGAYLSSAITVTASSGFQISNSATGTYTSSLILNPSADSVSSTKIYVRFSPLLQQNYSGQISHTSSGAGTKNVVVTGNGVVIIPASIKPIVSVDSIGKGKEFFVSVKLGDPVSVKDLYGISFKLTWDNTNCTYVEGSAANLDFLGTSPLTFTRKMNDKTVDFAVSKTVSPGSTGTGMLVRVSFNSSNEITSNQKVIFNLTDIVATNSLGNSVKVKATTDTILIKYADNVNVWPGDCNNDGLVNSADILPIGQYYGQTISQSNFPGVEWKSYSRFSWNADNNLPKRIYADADGDGTINAADILPVGLNYNKTHFISSLLESDRTIVDQKKSEVNNLSNPSLEIFSESPVKGNSNFKVNIIAGDIFPVKDLYGLSFKLTSNSSTCNYIENSVKEGGFLGKEILKLFRKIDNQTIDFAITKIATPGVNGSGSIAHFEFSASVPQDILFSLSDISAYDSSGKQILFNVYPANVTVSIKQEEIPNDFLLLQNYPNPFNPATTISYSIPKQSFVQLKVYDVLGIEVAALINEIKPAGNYEVEFNGRNLPSGIYFYKINAGDYCSVRKMLLVK